MNICSSTPIHLVLVADNSTSMNGAPAAAVTEGIQAWIEELASMTRGGKPYFLFSFIVFGSRVEVVCEGADVNDIDSQSVELHGDWGTTAMSAALDAARQVIVQHAASNHCPPFVFMFTDGQPDDPQGAIIAAQALKSQQLPGSVCPRLITLGFGNAVRAFLEQLATSSEFSKYMSGANDLANLLPSIGTPTKAGGGGASIEDFEKNIREVEI